MSVTSKTNHSLTLSIIITSKGNPSLLVNCLNSILTNKNSEAVEIIVAADNLSASESDLSVVFPIVRFIEFQKQTSIPVLTSAGIRAANGKIIALTDSSCLVDEDWIASIKLAHQLSLSSVIGGSVKIYGDISYLDLAAYYCEYGLFMPPIARGMTGVLPGNNISFKREVLAIGNNYTAPRFWKTLWCGELQRAGIKLILEPRVCVSYTKKFSLFPFLKRRFRHGRCFAGMRIKSMPMLIRLLYVTGSIFLPLRFFYRTIKTISGKKILLKQIFCVSPFILLAILSWSCGEFIGYLLGTGISCDFLE